MFPISMPGRGLLCALALAGASAAAHAVAVRSPLNGHLYEVVFSEGIGWDDARAAALARGPGWDLVSIGDAAENDFVKSLLDATLPPRSHFWIGATDRDLEGQWRWLDGTTFDFTDWAPNEPNNLGDEDLLAFDLVAGGWGWNDAPDALHAIYGVSRGFVVEAVPVPATVALLCAGLAGWGMVRRSRAAGRSVGDVGAGRTAGTGPAARHQVEA